MTPHRRSQLRSLRLGVATVAIALVGSAGANAATVHMGTAGETRYPGYGFYGEIETAFYTADPGERNRLVVTYDADVLGVTFSDPGAVIVAGESCRSIDAHTAHCVPRPYPISRQTYLQHVEVELGDLDDELDNPPPHPGGVAVRGGPGNDVLRGGDGPDELDGGEGTDTLLGGGSGDVVIDGEDTGTAGGGAPQADIMDGGPGHDLVSYRNRAAAVSVDVADDAPDGGPGEGDTVRAVEDAMGGAGPDRLSGDNGETRLTGNDGNDVLRGRGGRDVLRAGAGADALYGADGGDTLLGGAGPDTLSCGEDPDVVIDPAPGEFLDRHCNLISFAEVFGDDDEASFAFQPNTVARSRTSVFFRFGCPQFGLDDGEFFPCSGVLKLREGSGKRRLLGRAAVSIKREAIPPRAVAVRLTSVGRRLARRRSGVIATASLHRKVRIPNVAWTIRLKARR